VVTRKLTWVFDAASMDFLFTSATSDESNDHRMTLPRRLTRLTGRHSSCRKDKNKEVLMVRTVWLAAFVALGLALGGSLAHLYELPHKLRLAGEEYLVVQQIYRGWAWLAVPIGAALLSTLFLAIALRTDPARGRWALAAFAAIVGTQVIFWIWTYPVNVQTENWTVLPEHWASLRAQWEYSHAAGAVLNLGALVTLVLSALGQSR
jgi:hypothetical protein